MQYEAKTTFYFRNFSKISLAIISIKLLSIGTILVLQEIVPLQSIHPLAFLRKCGEKLPCTQVPIWDVIPRDKKAMHRCPVESSILGQVG